MHAINRWINAVEEAVRAAVIVVLGLAFYLFLWVFGIAFVIATFRVAFAAEPPLPAPQNVHIVEVTPAQKEWAVFMLCNGVREGQKPDLCKERMNDEDRE